MEENEQKRLSVEEACEYLDSPEGQLTFKESRKKLSKFVKKTKKV